MAFIKIDPKQMEGNPFEMIDRGMLLTAGDKTDFNTMTASWGGLGILWRMPVATCYVRPQRYTNRFMQEGELFTLCFLPGGYEKQLGLCGSLSGRDTDKVKSCGFTVMEADNGGIYFGEAELVIVCKKLYSQRFDPERFGDGRIAACYEPDDYHWLYIGEVLEILKRA